MRLVSKIIALLFALLFAWAAFLQHNDPDPSLWYSFYGVAAIACLLFLFNRFQRILGILLGVVYLAGTLWIWPDNFEGVEIGNGDLDNVERGREALGLLIAAVVMFFLAWQAKGKKS
ncbi:MAG: transmembrane 220 family protein [Eudoraea sp.]|nr:transmembrane 220 family protein [Eudoraea sp.]